MYLSGLGKLITVGGSGGGCAPVGGPYEISSFDSNFSCPTGYSQVERRFQGNQIFTRCVKTNECAPPAPVVQAPPTAPNINVNVPTSVQTQVSPQISPQFIQQQQPTNSPVGATSSMTSAPVSSSPTSPAQQQLSPDIARMIAETQQANSRQMQEYMLAQEAEREDFLRTLSESMSSQQSSAAPVMSPTVITVPSSSSETAAPIEQASISTPFGTIAYPAESIKKALPFVLGGIALFWLATRKKRRK